MTHTTKGMTRDQIAQLSLARRKKVLAYIERQGRVETNAIVAATEVPRSVLFKWLCKMVESGHVILEQENIQHEKGAHPTNFYLRGPNPDELVAYEHGSAMPSVVRDMPVKRVSKPAPKRIGMARDPWIAAIFGAPAVSA